MQLEGFDGPTWHEVEVDTWGYLIDVLPGMIRSGKLLARRYALLSKWRRRRGLSPLADEQQLSVPDDMTPEEADDLAGELALGAMRAFHRQLKQGRWDVRQDITFRSWVVNLCALRFGKPFHRWLEEREQRRNPRREAAPLDDEFDRPDWVIHVVEFERQLNRIDDVARRAVVRFDLDGLTDQQIADVTRKTIKQVEYALRKTRTDARRHRQLEDRRDFFREFGPGAA